MVVRQILSWLGIGTPKPREEKELLAYARKVAKNMGGELELPSDPEELKAQLSKLRADLDQVDGLFGVSAEEALEVFGSDEWKEAEKNQKEYWQYSVTLLPSIPLAVLERDGEISYEEHPELIGEANGVNQETGKAYNNLGIWLKNSTFRDYLFPEDDEDRQRKNNIEFLKDFRRIYENKELDVEQKIGAINALRDCDKYQETWENFWVCKMDQNFPKSVFIKDICTLPGISTKRAEDFWQQGLKTPEEVKNAPDEILLSISGIGKKTIEKMRSLKE